VKDLAVPALVAAVLLVGGGALMEPWHACGRHRAWTTLRLLRSSCPSPQRSGAASLKTLASAQADFRANDRDGDGVANFWRGDIAGLYALRPKGGGDRIKPIEVSTAAADDRPITDLSGIAAKSPKGGYWFRAIPHADEKDGLDPLAWFAACAFPADYPRSGRYTFILNEGNTIFKRDLGRPGGIEVFPTDEELRTQWAKLD
jgi:hypothetical protein